MKYQKKTIQAGELLYPEHSEAHLQDVAGVEEPDPRRGLRRQGLYHGGADGVAGRLRRSRSRPSSADTGAICGRPRRRSKSILFEGQLGALRDLDYGIYPYTTSSNTIAAYAPVGSGLPGAKLDEVVGVVKAYSSCVGEGPFTCEWFGPEAEELREAGDEYGAKTGRPRRVGPIDLVATRYGVRDAGAPPDIALTKLDVLSYMERDPRLRRLRG
ncbi:MAG: adenylosuccinate synthetase [Dysosmobacter sp.]